LHILSFLEKRSSFNFETNFSPNRIILGVLNQRLLDKNFCAIGNNFNDEIIELLTTATNLNIKLIIVKPQRLVHYLSEEESVLFMKSHNSSNFERSFIPNKINSLLLIKNNFRSNFMSLEIILNFVHNSLFLSFFFF
jgi:hypothetical protein